jgi:1-acylglycerone phosphate reductase
MSPTTRRWALVTGVSEGGLGDALTTELLKHDFNIIATALKLDLLSYFPQSDCLVRLELDVTSAASIAAAVKEVAAVTNGTLHLLVNNAGYGYMMPLMDADPLAVAKNFNVNVFGLVAVTQAFFPLLREANGVVANQCSISGLAGGRQPFIGTYSASKAAALSLSDTMRVELAPFGIKVRKSLSYHVVQLLTGGVRS